MTDVKEGLGFGEVFFTKFTAESLGANFSFLLAIFDFLEDGGMIVCSDFSVDFGRFLLNDTIGEGEESVDTVTVDAGLKCQDKTSDEERNRAC